MKWTIIIFPKFKNEYLINTIRKKYDPLVNSIQPHITLVFPFEWNNSHIELEKILKNRIKNIKSCGLEKTMNEYGKYLFLKVVSGNKEMETIHNNLYEDENLEEFKNNNKYSPHLTLVKFKAKKELEEVYEKLKKFNYIFESNIDKIYVEKIGENEESIIVSEILLG